MRHGQSTWNQQHRIQGQLDPPLSDEGRQQAALVGARLGGRRFAGFYTSDLKRAFETAQVIGASLGLAPEPNQSLREIFLGAWEGLRTEEIADRFPEAWACWVEEPDWDCVPEGGMLPFERVAHAAARRAGALLRARHTEPPEVAFKSSDIDLVTAADRDAEALIIASIAQAEAKYPEDYGKVARVILNRLAANRRLQVDATSAYAAKLAGLDAVLVGGIRAWHEAGYGLERWNDPS